MKLKFVALAMLAVALIALAACAPAAVPAPAATQAPAQATTAPAATEAPAQATTAPAATEAPAQETSAPDETLRGDKVDAGNCDYGSADALAEFKSIEAVDKYTVKFTLCHVDVAFLSKIAFITNAIGEKAVLDAAGGDTPKLSEKPNGTGPYRVKEWVHGD